MTIDAFNFEATVAAADYSLAGPNLTFVSIGFSDPTEVSGYYTSSLASAAPNIATFDGVQIYLSGQCFDNNVAVGDGCGADNFVEPFCRCSRTPAKWGTSQCTCAKNATTLLSFVDQAVVSIRDLSGNFYPGAFGSTVDAESLSLPTIAFSRCPDPVFGCDVANVSIWIVRLPPRALFPAPVADLCRFLGCCHQWYSGEKYELYRI